MNNRSNERVMTKKQLRSELVNTINTELLTIEHCEEQEEAEREKSLDYWIPRVVDAIMGALLFANGICLNKGEYEFINHNIRRCRTLKEFKLVLSILGD